MRVKEGEKGLYSVYSRRYHCYKRTQVYIARKLTRYSYRKGIRHLHIYLPVYTIEVVLSMVLVQRNSRENFIIFVYTRCGHM